MKKWICRLFGCICTNGKITNFICPRCGKHHKTTEFTATQISAAVNFFAKAGFTSAEASEWTLDVIAKIMKSVNITKYNIKENLYSVTFEVIASISQMIELEEKLNQIKPIMCDVVIFQLNGENKITL